MEKEQKTSKQGIVDIQVILLLKHYWQQQYTIIRHGIFKVRCCINKRQQNMLENTIELQLMDSNTCHRDTDMNYIYTNKCHDLLYTFDASI